MRGRLAAHSAPAAPLQLQGPQAHRATAGRGLPSGRWRCSHSRTGPEMSLGIGGRPPLGEPQGGCFSFGRGVLCRGKAHLPTLGASQGLSGSVGAWGPLEVNATAWAPPGPPRSCAWWASGCGGHRTQSGWGEGRPKRHYLATVGSLPVYFFLLNTHFILFLFVLLCIWEGELGSPSLPAPPHPVPRVAGKGWRFCLPEPGGG